MFLDGHFTVLDELERADPDVYDGWPLVRSRRAFKRDLKTGMAYPDLPCSMPHVDRTSGRVVLKVFRLCSHWQLFDMVQQSIWGSTAAKLTERYMSHLGSQSHLHAMSPDTASSADDVAYRTARQLLVLAHRAADGAANGNRSYPSWIGMLLHTVTDAYTPSHADRIGGGGGDAVLDAVAELDSAIYRLAKETVAEPLSHSAIRAHVKAMGSSKSSSSVHRAYLRYVMLHQSIAEIKKVIPDLRSAYDRAVARAHSPSRKQAGKRSTVARFWHYASQTTAEHMLGDMGPDSAHRAEMLRCCTDALRIMRDAVQPPQQSPKKMLLRLLDMLVAGPLRIRIPKCRGGVRSLGTRKGTIKKSSRSDPLDAAGTRPNPLTGAPFSAARARWAAVWSKFPLYSDKPKMKALVQSFRSNNVTIVVSGTGSGKTVLAVPLMLQAVSASPDSAIAVTIPKRTTVLAAARTGAMTMDVPLGAQVGYQFRGAPSGAASAATRILYSTDGTLLAQSRRDPLLTRFAAVVVDEAHERPLPTDLLLVAIRAALARRPEMRLSVMSATINPDEFVSYFEAAGLSVGVVHIKGSSMHPIERRFLGQPSNPLLAGVDVVRSVLADGRSYGNVLLFVPVMRDTIEGCKEILATPRRSTKGRTASSAPPTGCVPVYGKMSAEERDLAVASRLSRTRRTFVATNVAESSLTIPDLLDVVDTGLQLVSEYDARAHGTRVAREMATQAQITQRIGRAGRTAPGVAHLLYTQAQFNALPAFPNPAILSADLSQTLLEELVATSGKRGPDWFLTDLITPPTIDQLADAAMMLHFYGLVSVRPRGASGDDNRNRNFHDMPYATLRYRDSSDPQAQAVVTNALTGTIKTHDFVPTDFGHIVATAMQRHRLGLPYALLLVAGIACGCVREAAQLAVLLETVGGEIRSLWIDNGSVRPPRPPINCESTDHAAISAILQSVLLTDGDKGLATRGLAPSQWLAARRAVTSAKSDVDLIEKPDSWLSRAVNATCPKSFRNTGVGIVAAVLAARRFNAARVDRSGRYATTEHTLRPVKAEVQPMLPGSSYSIGKMCVFEELTLMPRGAKFSGITLDVKDRLHHS